MANLDITRKYAILSRLYSHETRVKRNEQGEEVRREVDEITPRERRTFFQLSAAAISGVCSLDNARGNTKAVTLGSVTA